MRRKKTQVREKVGKSRFSVFFPMICGSGGSKSNLAKAAGVEPAGLVGDEKLPAVVARSTFPSQNVQNTPTSDHFWKFRCRKSARRCGAQLQLHYASTVHHNYNSTTLQIQVQLHYTTLHPAVVGEVTTATIANTPKNTTPPTFRSISGFALPSMHHNNQSLL